MSTNSSFTASFDGQLWRIFPDADTHFLVLEIRNEAQRTASFASVDLHTKTILWQNFQLAETWWLGIEAVKNGCIYFHGYNHIQYANHLGISCVSIEKKTLIWERKDLIFHSINNENLLAQEKKHAFSNAYLALNFKTGEIIRASDYIPETNIHHTTRVFYPILFEESDASFAKIAKFLEKKTGSKAIHAIEYLEHNETIIISFYTNHNNNLQNRLILFDKEAMIIQDWLLGENLDGIGKQTFFIFDHKIIFVTYKTELNVYEL